MQLSARNSLYKSSLQNFDFSRFQPQRQANGIGVDLGTDESTFGGSEKKIFVNPTGYSGEFASGGLSDIKEVYEKMEFDAMRYNRNFDTQTGAEKI